MLKNVAGQDIGAQMLTAADGTAFTSTVTVYVTVDGGTQTLGTVGSGVCTHEGNGYHSYLPSQAETNGDHIAYTFIGTGAAPATLQIYTDATYDRIGAAGASLTDLGGMSTGMKAEVQTEADASLVAIHLDHLFNTTYDPASKPGAADALLNELIVNDAGVSQYSANALELAPGGTPSQPLLQSTTILAYTSNTSFTLTTASADDDAYLNQMCIITDQATGTQKAIGLISAYTGASKTVTLAVDPLPAFTFANGDTVEIWAVTGSQVGIEVDANGRVDVGNVSGTAQTAGDLANLITTVNTGVNGIQADLDNGTDGLGALSADITAIQADLDNGTDGLGALSADIAAAQADLNILTDTDGVIISTAAEAQLVDAVIDETLTSHVTADSLGVAIKDTLADTNELQGDDVPGLIAALNNVSVTDILTTQMTESYAADATAPTLAQALFLIQQSIGEFSISGTTLTVYEVDGTTVAGTYTLNDAADPTSRLRAT